MSSSAEDLVSAAKKLAEGEEDTPMHLYFSQAAFDKFGDQLKAIGKITVIPGKSKTYSLSLRSKDSVWDGNRNLEDDGA